MDRKTHDHFDNDKGKIQDNADNKSPVYLLQVNGMMMVTMTMIMTMRMGMCVHMHTVQATVF